MIEIELKFELKNKSNIPHDVISCKEVNDIYYDTSDYSLLRSGNFLRIRNDEQIDFKLNTNDMSHLFCKETNFLLAESNIARIKDIFDKIKVNVNLDSIKDINSNLVVLAPIKKKRSSYKLEENVVMVIDEVEDLGTFLEIEYDYNEDSITPEEANRIKEYLIDILKKNSLYNESDMKEVHIGYVELYLKKHNPKVYNLGIYKE